MADLVEEMRDAIWREDHYNPKLCSHGGDGGDSCVYCDPHDDETPNDWPADKERAERQAQACLAVVEKRIEDEFAKLPNYRGPDDPCADLVEQGYGNALTNLRAALPSVVLKGNSNG